VIIFLEAAGTKKISLPYGSTLPINYVLISNDLTHHLFNPMKYNNLTTWIIYLALAH
jgi:hypothetical protein